MAGEWTMRKLADLCESVDYGYTAAAKNSPCGPKFLRITDIVSGGINWDMVPFCEIDESLQSRYLLGHGDVVIARTGATTGYSAYVANPPDAVFASYLVRLKIGSEADPRFVAYFLKSPRFWGYMKGVMGDKSAQPNASARTMTQVAFPVPPLPEQRAIAGILGALDDKIELNRRMNRTLEAIARALFKSWFIDFDPVIDNALRAGHPIPDALADRAHVRKRLLDQRPPVPPAQDFHRLFPDTFTDSDLGPIPEGWEMKPIGEAVRCVGGATPSTKNPVFWEGGTHAFVTPKDMSSLESPVILDSERHITDAGVEKISSRQVPPGTVLLSSRAPIGYLALAGLPVSVNQGIIAMICDGHLPNLYVLYWTHANMDLIKSKAGGTTFAEISKRSFRPIPVIIPPDPVLRTFVNVVKPLHDHITVHARQNRTLAAIRDTLLPKLLSGEIDVSVRESLTEGVAEAYQPAKVRSIETRTETVIYTIGHSNHAIEKFIGLLRQHSITAIADVRSSPYSRHNPQFNTKALAAALKKAGIAYVFLGEELGARPKDPTCCNNGRVDFGRLAAREEFRRGIERVLKGSEKYRLALMCAEKEPLDCHRTILVCRHLRQCGVGIRHILADGSVEDHRQTEARLLKATGLEPTLFAAGGNDAQAIEQAYARRAGEIAYRTEKEEPTHERG